MFNRLLRVSSPTRLALLAALALALAAATSASAQDLVLDVSASSDIASPGETALVTVTVSNEGFDVVDDVAVDVALPNGIAGFREPTSSVRCPFDSGDTSGTQCGPRDTASWFVGDLGPGQSRALALPFRVSSNASFGSTLTVVATSGGQVDQTSIQVDDPLVGVAVVEATGTPAPGDAVVFEVVYGNRSASEADLVVTMPVPAGAAFRSATRGGGEFDGVVEWIVGPVAPGAGGRVAATFDVDGALPPGALIDAVARVRSDDLGLDVSSARAVSVREDGLQVAIASSDLTIRTDPFTGDREASVAVVTVSNAGLDVADDVSVALLLPDGIAGFREPTSAVNCPFDSGDTSGTQCGPRDTAGWFVGDLDPGESRTLALPLRPSDDLGSGRLLNLAASASLSGSAVEVLRFDDDPEVMISVRATERSFDSVTFEVVYGNRTGFEIDLDVAMPVPVGTVFRSATRGGDEFDGVVEWIVGPVAPGAGGRVAATFDVDAALPLGALIDARAEASSFDADRSDARTTVALKAENLEIAIEPTSPSVGPDGTVTFIVTATNDGFETVDDVSVALLLPDGVAGFREPTSAVNCPFDSGDTSDTQCGPRDTAEWFVGDLGPGQSRALPLLLEVDSEDGRILTLHAAASARGIGAMTQSDVFVGEVFATTAESRSDDGFAVRSYPSPFSATATIEINLATPTSVVVEVFDLTGRRVAAIHDGPLPGGRSTLEWIASRAASGLYLYRVRTPSGVRSGTVVKVDPR
jgi:hypothetical protein